MSIWLPQGQDGQALTPAFIVSALGFTPENVANKTGNTLSNSTTEYWSTKGVRDYVAAFVLSAIKPPTDIDCSANPNYPAGSKGDSYVVTVAGKIGGASGIAVDIGDLIVAKADNAGGTQAAVGASWFILEHNLQGALLSANNLSDLANAGTARTNLGVAIGVNVQAYNANLTTFAGIAPSANVQSFLGAANYAAMRTQLSLVPGTDVQAYDAELAALAGLTSAADKLPYFTGVGAAATTDLTSVARTLIGQSTQALMRTTGLGLGSIATLSAPVGTVVGTTDSQTLTNKTLTSPVINSPTGLVKGDVGLGSVDNTSDAGKPVSTAQQAALDLKVTGPGSSTANALARWNGTAGYTAKDSPVTLADTGVMSGLRSLQFTGATSGTFTIALPAVLGTNTLTLPAGTTDFSATGGSGQFVKQLSAGGAFTVASIGAAELPSGIDAGKIGAGSVSNTVFGYLGGVSSDIQTQIDGKYTNSVTAARLLGRYDLANGVVQEITVGSGLLLDSGGVLSATGGGGGAIGGSTGSTDKALIRANGTGGGTVQSSTVTLSDAGALSNVVSVSYKGSSSGATVLQASAVAGSTTLTLPASTDTLVGQSTSDVLANKTLTAPKFANAGFIADANGNELFILTTTASAVNEVTFANAATGANPQFKATGGDTDVGIDFLAKGAGVFNFLGNATSQSELRLFENTGNGTNYVGIKTAANLSANYTITLPKGSTDFSSTGGANQFLKQTSAGGAITVAVIGTGDLPTGIPALNIAGGSVDDTEFGYLDGVTSPIQTQLNGKLTGALGATDNVLVRSDGTGGATAQGSGITLSDTADLAGIATASFSGSTSGATVVQATAIAGSTTLTLPAATDTLVGKATTDTFTNKTFDTAGTGNSLKIGGVAVTSNTGTGAVVRANSPTLITPDIGTPSSGALTNCAGLPISTGVSGLGTGVAAMLATFSSANIAAACTDETGSGALVFANTPTFVSPLLGTPTSGTLTNCTGLPVSTGISGLASGIATFLATPSSANFAATVTDETGSGSLVFSNTPTLATPVFTGLPSGSGVDSAATAATLVSRDSNANTYANNFLQGYTATATAAGTTTLTVASARRQVFTGSTTQICKLPVVSTLTLGFQFEVWNTASDVVTVKSSGNNTILALQAGDRARFFSNATTGTGASVWDYEYVAVLASTSTPSTAVIRDGSGNFSAGTISASLSGNASTATVLATARSIYGNSFNGSADLTQVIGSAYGGTGNGFTKFSGPASAERTFTLPNANAVILTDAAAVTIGQGGTNATTAAGARTNLGLGSAATMTGPSGNIVGDSDAQTLTNKSIDLATNTLTGNLSQFNNALTGADFASLAGAETLSSKTLTAPKILDTGFIADDNGNEQIVFATTASAVNQWKVINAATGGTIKFQAMGDDSNIPLLISPKGTGLFQISDGADLTKIAAFDLSGATTAKKATIAIPVTNNRTITFFDASDTVVGKATTDTLTNKTFDTAGTGNSFSVNGVTLIGNTGTGNMVRTSAPTITSAVLVTPDLGTPTAGTLTNCSGLPIAGLVNSTSAALGLGSIELGHASDTTISRASSGQVNIEGAQVVTVSNSVTLTNKTLTTPVINGLPTGTGVDSAATASVLVTRDANANAFAANFLDGYAAVTTAAGTTTLTVSSSRVQVFTGTSTQTCKLPVVSTLALGHTFEVWNTSTGAVTVQSSGANAIVTLNAGDRAIFRSNATTGTGASVWDYANLQNIQSAATGGTGQSTYAKGDILASPGSNTLNKLTVGTDGQVLTADAASTNGVKWAAASGGGPLVATTTSDTTYTSNNTLAATGLSVTVAAAGIYQVDVHLIYSANSAGGIQIDLNGGSATATQFYGTWMPYSTSFGTLTQAAAISTGIVEVTTTVFRAVLFRGSLVVNAGGTFVLRASQAISNGNTTTIFKGAYMILTKLN